MVKPLELLETEFNVPASELQKAVNFQQRQGGRIEQILVNMGSLAEDVVPQFYARLLMLPRLHDSQGKNWDVVTESEQLTAQEIHEFASLGWLLLSDENENNVAVTIDPLNIDGNTLFSKLAPPPDIYIADNRQFSRLKKRLDATSEESADFSNLSNLEEERLRELASEAPTVNLLNSLISRALRAGASDMHVEPVEGACRIRFRVDGVLHSEEQVPEGMRLPLITRLKILSNMDIAEKRRPQDGKIEMRINQEDLDIRVSALPLNEGESVVMRFLRQESVTYDMSILGMAEDIQQQVNEDLKSTSGVILLTGPTGSGKTTSLYTFLNELNNDRVKIVTLEDPVEYQLEGINQVQVKADIGFDFAAGLRSIMRQDPDIIMVGEIRDKETARIAMQSALTGHLVFSTVHTNDAPSAYTRLLDLGVDEYLLNAALVSIIAQRLPRKLCQQCCKAVSPEPAMLKRYPLQQIADRFNGGVINMQAPVGCEHCNHTGYKGRQAIMEYLRCDYPIKTLPKDSQFQNKARELNQERGGRTLMEDGLLRVVKGISSLDEIIRVAG